MFYINIYTDTTSWKALLLLGLIPRKELFFRGMLFLILISPLSSPSLGLWDERFVLYRTLRTIYTGGVEAYRLRTTDTYWMEFFVLIIHLDNRNCITSSIIKLFNILNPISLYIHRASFYNSIICTNKCTKTVFSLFSLL
jgi:hypothetical protein